MRYGLTLIELLVVVGILSMLSGMILFMQGESEHDKVGKAAHALALAIDEARSYALRTGDAHAITFHVGNAGDGSVLRNFADDDPKDFPGRHWYAVIGPQRSSLAGAAHAGDNEVRVDGVPPIARHFDYHDRYSHPFLGEHVEAMAEAMIGERRYLPRGTRFLAFGEEDASSAWAAAGYPRPWHGYVDDDGNVFAWGGYSPAVAGSAFDYERDDGPISFNSTQGTNVHPSSVWGQISADATARNPGEQGKTIQINTNYVLRYLRHQLCYAVNPSVLKLGPSGNYVRDTSVSVVRSGPDTRVLPGTPRATLEGLWGDVMLVFDADGISYNTSGAVREIYFSSQMPAIDYRLEDTGGYHITIAPDIDPEDHVGSRLIYSGEVAVSGAERFDRVAQTDDYYQTITPFARVWIPREGGDAVVKGMEHADCRIRPEDCRLP